MYDAETTKQLAAELEREEIRDARAMPLLEKLLAGPRLYEQSRQLIAAGFRARHPNADETEIRRMVDERFALMRRLENGE